MAPPVISDVSASPNPFTPDGDGVNDTSGLTFSVSDTQTGAVSIELFINTQLVHTFPYTCLDGVKLPKIEGGYKKENLTWAWDGRINGEIQPDGQYQLTIRAKDLSNNIAQDNSVDFAIDTTGPAIDLGGLLVGWTESEKTVYTIEKDLPLRISDQAVGIRSVTIIGPGGAELENAAYSQPYPEEYSKDLSNLATGAYTIAAINGQDKTLNIYLNVGDLKAEFLPENSGALYDLTEDSYTARVAAHVSASFGIKNLEYVVDDVTVPLDPLKPDLLLYSRLGFKAWRFQPPADWENQGRAYVLRAQDYAGNGISIEYHLDYGFHYVMDLVNGASSTPIYDTLSSAGGSMLRSAVLPVKTESGFTLLEQNVSRYLTAVYGSGTGEASRPVPPLADPLFEMEFRLKTGNEPDLSDGQDLALVKRTYFTVRHDSGPIPPYCLAEGENAIAICYRDTVGDNVVIDLQRYYRAYTATTSAAQAMVCSRRSELDPDSCEAWTEFTPSPSILYAIHGIGLSEGTALGNTWNSVRVPSGENISVTLGGRINVSFPSVTQEGRLSLAFTSGSAPYAHTNLLGGAVVLTADSSLQYSGPVQVRAAFGDLGLTPSQEESLGVFYPSGTGTYALQDAALDAVNKTLSWSSSALAPFILAAQVYPAAYEQQAEDMGFISGEPGITLRTVMPGSDEFAGLSTALVVQKSKTALTGLHFVSPEGKTFSPAALVSLEVNREDAENFDIYEFSGDLSVFIKHPKQKISSASGTRYIAPVSMLHSYFAVLTDTEPPAGLLPDAAAPVVALSVTPEGGLGEGGMEISTSALITLSATDPDLPGYTTSGVAAVYYLLDMDPDTCGELGPVDPQAPRGTCQNYLYAGQFSLPVGTHTVYFNAVDNAGNMGEGDAVNFIVFAEESALPISPSSGPIGIPFTIEGTGFGTYSAGTTVVLLGNATAPLTLWTDTKIQGTIPGTLTAGQYPVIVKRGAEVLAEVSPFSVTQPALYALTPSSGAIGLPFTITGECFGNYVPGLTRVLLGGATMPLTLWTDTKIQGTIPGTLPAGDYELLVERALNGGVVRTSTTAFSLRNMEAYWLAPSTGPIGMPFTITGVGFGNYSAAYTQVLIGNATAPLTLWTDTRIQGTVPGSLVSGQYPVLVERKTADGGVMQTLPMTFEVVNVSVASMTPVAGPIGLPFAIYGTGFGNFSAGYTKVLIGGTTCPLTLWTDTKIQGTIPGSLAAGEHPVVVERALNGGQVQSVPVAFTVAAPEAYGLNPSSGPIGLPFTIMGANFGNYVANYTRVLIGGATAPLTLWTDTQIKGSIPGSLADGDHEVVVERALNGGVVRASTFSFAVGTPYLDTISPSTAAVVAPFTITGHNFGNYVANYTKVLINGATTALSLWTDTKIQGKLPYLLAGTYPVQVQRYLNGGLAESATAYISVEEPVISSMTPASGAVGSVFNLYGTGFGPYDATITKVFVGGVQCALSLWTDTRITGTVPSALSYGTHTVVAARGQALSNGLEFYIPGGYNPSMLRPGTGPSALEFKLGEVYVYPDPAKGGKVPTFHIEVGTADSVKLKVFTVAGQLAHEAALTGNPQAVGLVYAYEYAWTGHIASGVYYYTVEAERAGKKLKARGRFSVVR